MEFARGGLHIDSVDSVSDRFRRTVIGVVHHIADHVTRYPDEVG